MQRESAAELHSLVEKFEANVKVLKQLGEKTEFWDIILIRMLSIRLDPTTRRDWEEHSSTKDAISFTDLISFIQRRVTVLQTIQRKVEEAPASTQQLKKFAQRPIASNGANQYNFGQKCIFCSDQHPLYLCSSFTKLVLEEKEMEVHRHQLCRSCLRKGHHARDCSSSSSCRKCRGRHHTQLCSGKNSVAENSRTTESFQSEAPIASTSGEQPKASVSATIHEPVSYASSEQLQHNVLLATAVVKLVDDNGTVHHARALLDSGSECCFITETFAQLVKAHRKNISVPISGIGQSSSHARYKIVSTIRSRVSDYSTSAEFLVLPKVTIDLRTASFDTSSWQIPPGVHLAGPYFHESKQIDIVIGAEIFFELFKVPGRIPLGNSLPTLVNSVLGWIVSGKVSHGTPTKHVISNVALVADQHRSTKHFCSTEEDATPSSSDEQSTCKEQIRLTRLPTKDDASNALEKPEERPTTICPVFAEPSFIELHMDKFCDHDTIRQPPIIIVTTSYVTERKNKAETTLLRLIQQQTFAYQ
ncbi:uncharacterized protein LOC135711831 [Ochlerotatus camptorhynchus]|uniref:uncharacterized protein LOC135711831 n=1 Tax=Ochlerotatus camptorhynchus TaxID=644619 RepID=UPI0031DDCCEA